MEQDEHEKSVIARQLRTVLGLDRGDRSQSNSPNKRDVSRVVVLMSSG